MTIPEHYALPASDGLGKIKKLFCLVNLFQFAGVIGIVKIGGAANAY